MTKTMSETTNMKNFRKLVSAEKSGWKTKYKKRKTIEDDLHKSVCKLLDKFYPKLMYNTDMSGIKLTKGQAIKAAKLRSWRGFPDIMIYHSNGIKCGMFLELKKSTPYKKNGELSKKTQNRTVNGIKVKYDHHQEQNDCHIKLRNNGWSGGFYWSIEQVIQAIDIFIKGGFKKDEHLFCHDYRKLNLVFDSNKLCFNCGVPMVKTYEGYFCKMCKDER